MVQRTVRGNDQEPEQMSFEKPSEKEHLFQVVDVYDLNNDPYGFGLGADDASVKCEVVGGEEEGRSLLIRLSVDDTWKGFFATKLFLKAIGEPYKGDQFPINSDNWTGRQFYATVVHNVSKIDKSKTYANIKEYNFEKLVDNSAAPSSLDKTSVKDDGAIAWDE